MKTAKDKSTTFLLVSTVLTGLAVLLMAAPHSVSLTFAPAPDERSVYYLSYFSWGYLIGYAHFPPVTASIFTIIWFITALVRLVFGKVGNAALCVWGALALIFAIVTIFWEANTQLMCGIVAAVLAAAYALQLAALRAGSKKRSKQTLAVNN